jgi:hypothetical protein
MSEIRFSLGGVYNEVWIRYWIRVPVNFDMTASAGSGDNNKWFALWQDGYSGHGTGATIMWNFWRQSLNGGATHSFSMARDSQGGGHHAHYSNFMLPQDAGRWMQVVLHAKNSSASGEADGEAHIWRRWEDEAQFTPYFGVYQSWFFTSQFRTRWMAGWLYHGLGKWRIHGRHRVPFR